MISYIHHSTLHYCDFFLVGFRVRIQDNSQANVSHLLPGHIPSFSVTVCCIGAYRVRYLFRLLCKELVSNKEVQLISQE